MEISEHSKHSSEEQNEDQNFSTSEFGDESSVIRVQTAPARPLTNLEEFKRQPEFLVLEQAVFASSSLIQKNLQKYELDTIEGSKKCKKFFQIIERLCEVYSPNLKPKIYRKNFSQAYQILYKDGGNYLTEILDSAQEGFKYCEMIILEGFPYLWVNGEKYIFSNEVLDLGRQLLKEFFLMQNCFKNVYSKLCSEADNTLITETKQKICISLESFDRIWCKFEQLYVTELMIIENDARRYITQAIEQEKDLQSIEIRERLKGRIIVQNQQYHKCRKELAASFAQLNALANVEGKGRDDLQFEILLEAEGIIRRITKDQSKSVIKLAEKIRAAFNALRQLIHSYEANLENVDPQLKNNSDLVECLIQYENSWEKGKHYLLDGKKCNYLIHFSHIIQTVSEKYPSFYEQIEERDSEIFLKIPCLLVLKALNQEDKHILKYFLPQIHDTSEELFQNFLLLQDKFNHWKTQNNTQYLYYNILEKKLIGIPLQESKTKEWNELNCLVHDIKQMAMILERNNPMEWNDFLEVSLYFTS